MKVKSLFKEYIWIINTIYKARYITLKELNEKWVCNELSGGLGFTKLTFWRHRQEIREDFGIDIDCDRRRGMAYFIANEEVMKENSIQTWMLNTLSVNNIVSGGIEISNRVMLESISSNSEALETIVKAMKKGLKVELTYRRYGADTATRITAEPYCIKLWNQRWYTLLHFHREATEEKPERDYFGVYSFDRIESVTLTQTPYCFDKDFDAEKYFEECYGVLAGDGTKAERVVLRALGREVYYMRSLPMHHSQKEINTTEEYADFEFFIRPTTDFIDNILAHNTRVKVMEPQWLVDEIKAVLMENLKLYE